MNQFPPSKFATCVNDTGGKFATGVVYTMGTIIKLLTTYHELEKKIYLYANQRGPKEIIFPFATGVNDTSGAP
jgi:hypothetical protein